MVVSTYLQAFLLKGMAVVSVDLRGCGASFGNHGGPWLEQEAEDSEEILHYVSEGSDPLRLLTCLCLHHH